MKNRHKAIHFKSFWKIFEKVFEKVFEKLLFWFFPLHIILFIHSFRFRLAFYISYVFQIFMSNWWICFIVLNWKRKICKSPDIVRNMKSTYDTTIKVMQERLSMRDIKSNIYLSKHKKSSKFKVRDRIKLLSRSEWMFNIKELKVTVSSTY